eukprot:m.386726 g.386726  ORF g.386726 m.386726 type:complete len:1086 (-) comp16745_c3_seq74:1525-4782(-)
MMGAAGPREELTQEELADLIRQTLRQSGMVNSLKSQLRNKVLSELQTAPNGPRLWTKRKSDDALQLAADSLVLQHLEASGYEYTASVFVPESLGSTQTVLSRRDALRAFDVHPRAAILTDASVAAPANDGRGGLIECMRVLCQSYAEDRATQGTQTSTAAWDEDDTLTSQFLAMDRAYRSPNGGRGGRGIGSDLGAKLAGVDAEFHAEKRRHTEHAAGGIEDQMRVFEQRCEARSKEWARLEVERIRAVEIEQLKAAERKRYQEKLDRMRAELERGVAAKELDLKHRAAEIDSAARAKQMEVDKVNFEARQRMLALRDQTHAQEAALKREVAVTTRSTQLQDDALRQMERQLKLKEATLEEYRSQCDSKIAAEVVKARLEAKTELAEESERLRVQEAKLRDEMALVRQQQQIHDRLVEDVATARSTLDACQAELRSKHEELGAANAECRAYLDRLDRVKDYDVVLRQATHMRADMLAAKQQQKDLELKVEHLETVSREQLITISSLKHQANIPSVELVELREKYAAMMAAHEQLRENHRAEANRADDLTVIRGQLDLQIKEQTRQIADLRKLLRQLMETSSIRAVQPMDYRTEGPAVGQPIVSRGGALEEVRRRLADLQSGHPLHPSFAGAGGPVSATFAPPPPTTGEGGYAQPHPEQPSAAGQPWAPPGASATAPRGWADGSARQPLRAPVVPAAATWPAAAPPTAAGQNYAGTAEALVAPTGPAVSTPQVAVVPPVHDPVQVVAAAPTSNHPAATATAYAAADDAHQSSRGHPASAAHAVTAPLAQQPLVHAPLNHSRNAQTAVPPLSTASLHREPTATVADPVVPAVQPPAVHSTPPLAAPSTPSVAVEEPPTRPESHRSPLAHNTSPSTPQTTAATATAAASPPTTAAAAPSPEAKAGSQASAVPAWKRRLEEKRELEERQKAEAARVQAEEDARRQAETARRNAERAEAEEKRRKEEAAEAERRAVVAKAEQQEAKAAAGLEDYVRKVQEKKQQQRLGTLAAPVATSTPQQRGSTSRVPVVQGEIETEEPEEEFSADEDESSYQESDGRSKLLPLPLAVLGNHLRVGRRKPCAANRRHDA